MILAFKDQLPGPIWATAREACGYSSTSFPLVPKLLGLLPKYVFFALHLTTPGWWGYYLGTAMQQQPAQGKGPLRVIRAK